MSDGQLFLLVFLAIYISECVCWLPRRGFGLTSWRCSGWKVKRASPWIGSEKSGTVLAFPLPPLGTVFLAQQWPVSVTPSGVSSVTLENPNPGGRLWQPVKSCRWEEVREISRQGKKVIVNGRKFVGAATPALADAVAMLMGRLSRCPAEERAGLIRHAVVKSLNVRHARRMVALFLKATRELRWTVNALFFISFVGVPFAYWAFADSWRFFAVLGLAWVTMLQISIQFFCLHRRFFPGLSADRWQYFFLSVLVPQFTVRVLDELSKGLLRGTHPVAAIGAIATEEVILRETRRAYRDLKHPLGAGAFEDEAPGAVALAKEFHEEYLLPELSSSLSRRGLDVEQLSSVGGDENAPGGRVFCPRCGEMFVVAVPECEDCGGMATVTVERRHLSEK